MNKDIDINNHLEQLQQLCNVCKRENKCKDHMKVCAIKKIAWNYAKARYKRKQKEGAL